MKYKIVDIQKNKEVTYFPRTVAEAVLYKGANIGNAVESLQGMNNMDADAEETYLGTFSKTLDGGYMQGDRFVRYIHFDSVEVGEQMITISFVDRFIIKEFFVIHGNGTFTINSVDFSPKSVTVNLYFQRSYENITIPMEYVLADQSAYDLVEISIPSSRIDPVATVAKVKFNQEKILLLSTDDGGISDFSNNWMRIQGHPVYAPASGAYYGEHGETIYSTEGDATVPFEYGDGTGGTRRFGFSCAVMTFQDTLIPTNEGGDPLKFHFEDVVIMQRLGTSVDFHDQWIDDSLVTDADGSKNFQKSIKEYTKLSRENSDFFKANTGIGVKVWVIPSGIPEIANIAARSKGNCLVCDQGGREYKDDKGNVYTTYPYPMKIDRWTEGRDLSSFSKRNAGIVPRWYEMTYDVYQTRKNDEILIPFGHSFNSEMWKILEDVRDNAPRWVCSFDEFWEYYHLYNNIIIESCTGDGSTVKLKMWVPRYESSQFRETTINLNITDGGVPVASGNVIGLSFKQDINQYVMNISLEERWIENARNTLDIYKRHPNNTCIRRDAEYLIGLLKDGDIKDELSNALVCV